MTIGMVVFTGTRFPTDIRVQKECLSLHKAGHRIIILTQLFLGQEKWEKLPLFSVVRVPILNRLLCDPLSYFTLIYRQHKKHIRRFIQEHNPEVLHIHDFDLVPTAIKASAGKIPVIADLHENGPASFVAFRAYDRPIKRFIRFMLYNYKIWKKNERKYLPLCRYVITVVPEATERLKEYGVDSSRIKIISNTESQKTFNPELAQISPDITKRYENSWVMSYIGGIGPHRGIDTVIKAMPMVLETIPNLLFVIVGARGKEAQTVQRWADKADVGHAVEIIKWLSFEKIHTYLLLSQVALIPHNDFEHTQTTVPHKLFQHMISEVPVLVSDCRPLKRIVGDNDLGYVFKAGDPESLARELCAIHANPIEVKRKAEKARDAALGPYNWENDAAKLIEIYKPGMMD